MSPIYRRFGLALGFRLRARDVGLGVGGYGMKGLEGCGLCRHTAWGWVYGVGGCCTGQKDPLTGESSPPTSPPTMNAHNIVL